jgi:hypothetical protein
LGAIEKLGFWELLQEELLESFHWFLWTGFFAYSSSKSHIFDHFCWKGFLQFGYSSSSQTLSSNIGAEP